MKHSKLIQCRGASYFFQSLIVSFLTISLCFKAFAIEVGENAPDLAADSPIRLELEQYSGSVIYVDFWASWCGSCQLSLPWMNEISNKFKERKFQIIAVSLDQTRASAEQLIARVNPDYAIKFDPEGKLAVLYGVASMPSSYLIGVDGRVLSVYRGFGEKHKDQIDSDIENALAGGAK